MRGGEDGVERENKQKREGLLTEEWSLRGTEWRKRCYAGKRDRALSCRKGGEENME